MAVQKTGEGIFENLSNYLIIDVRSPGEYAHAHIPTAFSLPLFTDEERAEIGTTYKQESREAANFKYQPIPFKSFTKEALEATLKQVNL
jgi:tRNA 2-selenouridine synthase